MVAQRAPVANLGDLQHELLVIIVEKAKAAGVTSSDIKNLNGISSGFHKAVCDTEVPLRPKFDSTVAEFQILKDFPRSTSISMKRATVLDPDGFGSLLRLLPGLERIRLENCALLSSLPVDLGSIGPNLRELDLKNNKTLTQLPDSIADLPQLERLILDGCGLLVCLPQNIGRCTTLKDLSLQSCHSITELPTSIGNLINLEKLSLELCSKLTELPESIGGLVKLKFLNLTSTSKITEFPETFFSLTNLQVRLVAPSAVSWYLSFLCATSKIRHLSVPVPDSFTVIRI